MLKVGDSILIEPISGMIKLLFFNFEGQEFLKLRYVSAD